jgi:hypothetical protein
MIIVSKVSILIVIRTAVTGPTAKTPTQPAQCAAIMTTIQIYAKN